MNVLIILNDMGIMVNQHSDSKRCIGGEFHLWHDSTCIVDSF